MDVVYRYRTSGSGEELKYSLRSLRNISHDDVWIVGDIPHWVKNVRTLRVPQNKHTKWANSRNNLIQACRSKGLSEDFIMMDDDFFLMEEIDSIPVWHRGLMKDVIEKNKISRSTSKYTMGLVETRELLIWAGAEEPLYTYNLHIPMQFEKSAVLEYLSIIDKVSSRHIPQCFHLRSWYGNLHHIGGSEARDVKVYNRTSPIPPGPLLSTSNQSFANNPKVRKLIMKTFSDPSPYE